MVAAVACKQKEQQTAKPAVPVMIGIAAQKAVPLQINAIGNVEASSTVAVKAQVGGTLIKVHFTEGQDVKKGELLFTIDPRPYEAALKQAEAIFARDRAQFENARAEERRYAELVKKGYVSETQYEQVRTNAVALEAVVQSSKAQVENAHLQLAYCTIRSPFSGRTGSLSVYEGNLIKASADSPMVTINQIQPVNVSFAVPEKTLPEIKKYMTGGALKVEVLLSKDDRTPLQGSLTFIDNAVDTATGMIRLKGSFANNDRKLWPGQFVNLLLTLMTQSNAVVVPTQAVQTGQKGPFVFVVKEDATAEARSIVVSRTFGDESVIESGLKPGEKVVTDGQLRLSPGAKVEVKSKAKDKTEAEDKDQVKAEDKVKDSREQKGKDKAENKDKVKEQGQKEEKRSGGKAK
ncbi:MAG: efflux RND transporter periplasmic adaptor subunit [Nitrospirae bacterium]|nr:efflux RND transporter periplasmic adaptor subunit [Nitrospirota bacterium]